MPVIPDDAVSNILKPDKIKATIGEHVDFTIVGTHKVNSGGTTGMLYSVPVKCSRGEGDFPLNKTNMTMFCEKMTKNSDVWQKWKFTAFVVPRNNPQSNILVNSWAVIPTSFVAPKSASK